MKKGRRKTKENEKCNGKKTEKALKPFWGLPK